MRLHDVRGYGLGLPHRRPAPQPGRAGAASARGPGGAARGAHRRSGRPPTTRCSATSRSSWRTWTTAPTHPRPEPARRRADRAARRRGRQGDARRAASGPPVRAARQRRAPARSPRAPSPTAARSTASCMRVRSAGVAVEVEEFAARGGRGGGTGAPVRRRAGRGTGGVGEPGGVRGRRWELERVVREAAARVSRALAATPAAAASH